MSSEPNDEVVEHAIQSALSTMSTSVRPNKLRKIICKQLPDTNWTQYQRVLERLVENKCVHLQETNGEKVIVVSQTGNSQSAIGTNVELTQKVDGNTRTPTMTDREEIQVPFEIFLHLTKKGRKKQKNIETNTKTKITFHNENSNSNKTRSEDNLKGSICTVIITKAYALEDGTDEKEAKEKAQKQIKAAKLYITKMIQSFEKNPDHFIPRKAGGTFAEQAEAKKRKSEVVALMNKKKKSAGSSNKTSLSTSDSSDKVENDNDIKTKKVRRKYY